MEDIIQKEMEHEDNLETEMEQEDNLEVTHSMEDNLQKEMEHETVDKASQLQVGTHFDSLNIAGKLYKEFAKVRGFGVRIRTSKKANRSNELVSRIYVCANEGFNTSKKCENDAITTDGQKIRRHSSSSRMGCQATFRLYRIRESRKWVVTKFNDTHNHTMLTPGSVHFHRSHKNMPDVAKNLVEKFNEEGLPTGKVAAICRNVEQEFSEIDCWNHLRQLQRKNLDVGDAHALLCYFKKKQGENPNFFYAIQCDVDARLVNVFWVDARSRLAYEFFGDAITFDTTYKTNKYNMPFAPFVGLNHHCQSILFGCALLQDESEQSFIWLFETWLEAMHGKLPVSIITDQDLAIGAAVKKVFRTSRHRVCLWHIKKKFPEKLAQVYHRKSTFKHELKGCIRESYIVEEFEKKWQEVMATYDLQDHDWLQSLWNIRESWVPVYNRTTFFAGMNTTQRSESINAFFDEFVHSTTTLREFVIKYEKAVNSRYAKEKREDYESRSKTRVLQIGSKIEQQAAAVYTRKIFNMFQDELIKSSHFSKTKVEKNGSSYRYLVSNAINPKEQFHVSIDLATKMGTCECHLFEFMGILCRHILAIFQSKNIFEIPSHYILPRWTKEANSGCKSLDNVAGFEESLVSGALRGTYICCEMNQLASIAINSEKAFHIIRQHLKQIYEEVSTIDEDEQTVEGQKNKDDVGNESVNVAIEDELCSMPINIVDPHISQTKGRKKDRVKESSNGRLKGGLEIALASQTTKRKCHGCGEYGHNIRSCKQQKQEEN